MHVIARLAALVPKPRVNLTRLHGVFAPNSRDRASVTSAKRGESAKAKAFVEEQDKTPALNERALLRHSRPQWDHLAGSVHQCQNARAQ